jgi:hypothetical protein
MQEALNNLKAALEGRRRGTKRRVTDPDTGRTEHFGSLTAVAAADVVACCEAVPPDKLTQVVRDLRKGSRAVPPDTVVRVEADDLYHLTDLLAAPAAGA